MDNTRNNIFKLNEYLKRVSDTFSSKKKITDILNDFRLMTPEYQELNEDVVTNTYSNILYSECTDIEKTVFANTELLTFESSVCTSIYEKHGIMTSWVDVYNLILDPIYKNVDKINRKVIYSSKVSERPIGDNGYISWNGLQIIDLDIKNAELSEKLKPIIFSELSKYHWFLGVCKSASGKSLHIWTKITPISIELSNKRVEYICNFRHKYSYIYIVLAQHAKEFGYTEEEITTFMDMAMAKPQQGIFISSDDTAMMSTNFKDRRLDVNFEPAFESGVESIDWISHPKLKSIFSKLDWFASDRFDHESNIKISELSNTNDRDLTKNVKKHYKHAQRWQLANTLTNIYGYDKALIYMMEICKETPFKEIKGDVRTAEIHHKPISVWAVKQLNTYHGFKIKFEDPQNIYNANQKDIDKFNEIEAGIEMPGISSSSNLVELKLERTQYLSDIKDQILNNLSHITLLEAGAGYGKTEMIKAFKAKTCLILPFTSTIKSKVEKSETTADWLYYYGNKRPSLDELMGHKNMSMTIDKFSRLNVMELDQAGFEYIVLDESHLLFTSSYRDVMAPTIQRLANCKAKIIMMTGTPTGELTFFPGIKHIRVKKSDSRIKDFQVHFCTSGLEQLVEMCKMMGDDIISGKKILFPTNKGNLYYDQVTGIIQEYLDNKHFGREINKFYYKKSNYGDESMDSINYDKTIGNNDIIFCTTYLSVGVDIWDKYQFSVYFNEPWIPQDIEQFANRLRGNDLFVKLFLPKLDNTGYPINYYMTSPLDLSFNQVDLLLARDLIRTCNDMIERNDDEAKASPLVQSIISANRYLKYDENACKYYIDETMYKLRVFEDRYAQFNKQLPILIEGMKHYGYTVSQVEHEFTIPEDQIEAVESHLKSCRTRRYNEMTNQIFAFLDKINDNNIDVYRDIIKGDLDILRGKDDVHRKIREDNAIYTESIEVVEKNTPIVLALYKYYDCDTIKDIYQHCRDSKLNRVNFTKLSRIRRFIGIVSNIKRNRLDFPIYKFVTDAKRFAIEHPISDKNEIEKFIINETVSIANNINGLIVEDVGILETIKSHLDELWKVVVESKASKGKVKLTPFELLWHTKDSLDTVYGGNITKEFFIQELIDEMETDDTPIIEESNNVLPSISTDILPELTITSKVKLSDKLSEVMTTVHSDYSYFEYSKDDGSNDRFMEKQKNTNMLRDSVFDSIEDETQDNNVFISDTLF